MLWEVASWNWCQVIWIDLFIVYLIGWVCWLSNHKPDPSVMTSKRQILCFDCPMACWTSTSSFGRALSSSSLACSHWTSRLPQWLDFSFVDHSLTRSRVRRASCAFGVIVECTKVQFSPVPGQTFWSLFTLRNKSYTSIGELGDEVVVESFHVDDGSRANSDDQTKMHYKPPKCAVSRSVFIDPVDVPKA